MIAPAASFSEFVSIPDLLGGDFADPSWDAWKITIAAALGEPMSAAEIERFRELAGRDPPPGRVRELWLAIGRRGGKDSIAAALATYLAVFGDFAQYLRRGERATVACLAVTKVQAGIVFGYIRANLVETPVLAPFVAGIDDTANKITLGNGVDIVVLSVGFRGLRGRSIACAILDECAYWYDETMARPDTEVYRALLPGTVMLRPAGPLIVGISTVYRRSGLLYEKITKHLGQDDPHILAIRQPSAVYNPLLAEDPLLAADIAEQRQSDPEAAAADWDSVWRADLADFVDRLAAEACVVKGRFELPPVSGTHYIGFVDTSGSGADAMSLAIAHDDRQSGHAVLDLARERRPPFSPEAVTAEFAAILKSYRCFEVTGDKYAGEWPREQFRKYGVTYSLSERSKSEIYVELLPLINSGRVELLDYPRLFHQLIRLERRTGRGTGRDVVDHPRAEHDDLINAAAGALIGLAEPVGVVITPEALAAAQVPVRRRW